MTEIISISEQHNLTVKFLIDKYNFAYLRINVKKIKPALASVVNK